MCLGEGGDCCLQHHLVGSGRGLCFVSVGRGALLLKRRTTTCSQAKRVLCGSGKGLGLV
jgi:hypothetical protein